jgi:hypothetical protein
VLRVRERVLVIAGSDEELTDDHEHAHAVADSGLV